MTRDTWVLNNHEPRAHALRALHTQCTANRTDGPCVRTRVCANDKIHCNAWGIPFQNFMSTVLVYVIGTREYNVISFNFKLLA